MANLQRELFRRLKEDGMTQTQVADKIGVHETYISNFLSGKRGPNEKLLAYLGYEKRTRVTYVRKGNGHVQ
jgi:transcriptional regulator with XRE-family HTH domain